MITTAFPNNTTKKQNKAISYFRTRISDMRLLLVVYCMLSAAAMLLLAIILSYYTRLDKESYQFMTFEVTPFLIITGFSAFGMLLLTYAIAISSFSHLHNKNICDMHISLPLNHASRFWVNFTTGLSMVIIPYTVFALISLFVIRFFSDFAWLNQELEHFGGVSGLLNEYGIPIFLTGLLVFTAMYALTIFCCTICGRIFMAVFYPLLLSGGIPLTIAMINAISVHGVRGLEMSISAYPLIISTPLGFLYGSLDGLTQYGNLIITNPIYTVPVIMITAGLIAAAYFLSKNVKAENIGNDLLFKKIYNIQQFGICFSITALFIYAYLNSSDTAGVITWMFIISGTVFLVSDIIHHRGFKGMKKAVIKYAAAMMASILLCAGIYATNSFGTDKYIPSASDIATIQVYYYGNHYYEDFVTREYYDEEYGEYYKFDEPTIEYRLIISEDVFRDRHTWFNFTENNYSEKEWDDIITATRTLHQTIIDTPGDDWFFIHLDYQLKNGKTIRRAYQSCDTEKLIEMGVLEYELIEHNRNEYYW